MTRPPVSGRSAEFLIIRVKSSKAFRVHGDGERRYVTFFHRYIFKGIARKRKHLPLELPHGFRLVGTARGEMRARKLAGLPEAGGSPVRGSSEFHSVLDLGFGDLRADAFAISCSFTTPPDISMKARTTLSTIRSENGFGFTDAFAFHVAQGDRLFRKFLFFRVLRLGARENVEIFRSASERRAVPAIGIAWEVLLLRRTRKRWRRVEPGFRPSSGTKTEASLFYDVRGTPSQKPGSPLCPRKFTHSQ